MWPSDVFFFFPFYNITAGGGGGGDVFTTFDDPPAVTNRFALYAAVPRSRRIYNDETRASQKIAFYLVRTVSTCAHTRPRFTRLSAFFPPPPQFAASSSAARFKRLGRMKKKSHSTFRAVSTTRVPSTVNAFNNMPFYRDRSTWTTPRTNVVAVHQAHG